MQAKIIDFASDKISKSLNKIEKKDIQNVYSNISSKMRRSEKSSHKESGSKLSSSKEFSKMIKNEFVFKPNGSKDPHRKSGIHYERSDDEESRSDEFHSYPHSLDVESNEKNHNFNEFEQVHGAASPNQMKSGVESFIQKKNMAQGMMDMALVSANCNQLRYVLDMSSSHPYFFTSLGLIISSLTLQVIVGICLLYANSYNLKRKAEMKSADRINSFSIYGVFLITLTNFLISAFSGTNMSMAGHSAAADDDSKSASVEQSDV